MFLSMSEELCARAETILEDIVNRAEAQSVSKLLQLGRLQFGIQIHHLLRQFPRGDQGVKVPIQLGDPQRR